jgi:DNA mismatch endonuclease (patch repair protein)
MTNKGWVSTAAGAHLSGRKKKDTSPEIALRKALYAQGARFRLHRQLAKGCTPDIVMPGRGLAIFVDGCFWHGCPEHGRKTAFTGPNARLWADKMLRNAERDQRSSALAESLGWKAIRVWECEVRDSADRVATEMLEGAPTRRSGPPVVRRKTEP